MKNPAAIFKCENTYLSWNGQLCNEKNSLCGN